MMAQGVLAPALMEADVGTAKYEHIYRSVVWRIPRLPVRNQGNFMLTHPFNLDPLNPPLLYIVELGFVWVYIFFAKNIHTH